MIINHSEAERDRLKAENAELRAKLNQVEACWGNTECAELRVKPEQAEAKCAEMNSPTWPWVRAFASEMERKLSLNLHKGGREGWVKDDPWSLVERLLDETVEIQQCFTIGSDGRVDFKDAEELTKKCADVANFAMMITDAAGGLKAHTDCGKGILEKVRRLREALNGLRPKGGCFCDAQFAMPNGTHPIHTAECVVALQAIAETGGEK